jgi:hypothetical protein
MPVRRSPNHDRYVFMQQTTSSEEEAKKPNQTKKITSTLDDSEHNGNTACYRILVTSLL